jgi:hypothetical protein
MSEGASYSLAARGMGTKRSSTYTATSSTRQWCVIDGIGEDRTPQKRLQ